MGNDDGHSGQGKTSSEMNHRMTSLLHAPGNQVCADCPARRPLWASFFNTSSSGPKHLGVFCCSSCAQHHYFELGDKRCSIKYLKMAHEWTMEDLTILEASANDMVNRVYEGSLIEKDFDKSLVLGDEEKEDERRSKFIKHKYKKRKYVDQLLFHGLVVKLLQGNDDGTATTTPMSVEISIPDDSTMGTSSSCLGVSGLTEPDRRRQPHTTKSAERQRRKSGSSRTSNIQSQSSKKETSSKSRTRSRMMSLNNSCPQLMSAEDLEELQNQEKRQGRRSDYKRSSSVRGSRTSTDQDTPRRSNNANSGRSPTRRSSLVDTNSPTRSTHRKVSRQVKRSASNPNMMFIKEEETSRDAPISEPRSPSKKSLATDSSPGSRRRTRRQAPTRAASNPNLMLDVSNDTQAKLPERQASLIKARSNSFKTPRSRRSISRGSSNSVLEVPSDDSQSQSNSDSKTDVCSTPKQGQHPKVSLRTRRKRSNSNLKAFHSSFSQTHSSPINSRIDFSEELRLEDEDLSTEIKLEPEVEPFRAKKTLSPAKINRLKALADGFVNSTIIDISGRSGNSKPKVAATDLMRRSGSRTNVSSSNERGSSNGGQSIRRAASAGKLTLVNSQGQERVQNSSKLTSTRASTLARAAKLGITLKPRKGDEPTTTTDIKKKMHKVRSAGVLWG